jgi:hypothetical protein
MLLVIRVFEKESLGSREAKCVGKTGFSVGCSAELGEITRVA